MAVVTMFLVVVLMMSTLGKCFTTESPCKRHQTCHQCLQDPGCAWCARPLTNLSTSERRCYHRSRMSQYCAKDIVDMNNTLHILKAEQLSDKKNIQITPQKISLKLRVNMPINVTINYKESKDLPLDLYYLTDVSGSMHNDMENLKNLAQSLSDEMINITSKFQLGFGTFIDKYVLPFTIVEVHNDDKRKRPFHGFRHRLSLTQNTKLFKETVNQVNAIYFVTDGPEGGFDALLQVVVCKKAIGWRENARRLVLFTTDAWSHTALDGKLAGLDLPNDGLCHLDMDGEYDHSNLQDYPSVSQLAGLDLPNDGLCHLDMDGEYDHSNLQDYPSVSQINMEVLKNKVIVIFAVTRNMEKLYRTLSSRIVGSTVAVLEHDSSNIVNLIKQEYQKIKSTVEMDVKTSDPSVKVKLFSSCGKSEAPQLTKICKDLSSETTVTFTAEVELISCPKYPSQHPQTIEISPLGLNQSLIIELDKLCNCPCELLPEQGFEKNSSKCSNAGDYQCGVCVCETGRVGHMCQCNTTTYLEDGNDNCRREKNDSKDCSSHGHCVCGQCVCDQKSESEKFYGQYCECDNFSCKHHKNRLCNHHGTCDCGTCKCDVGWEGSACECSLSLEPCTPPGGVECSGHGHCKCGECHCGKDKKGNQYYGTHCQYCSGCSEHCDKLRDCVECKVFNSGPLNYSCEANCSTLTIKTTKELIVQEASGENFCMLEDYNSCTFKFVYFVDDNKNWQVRAHLEKECPQSLIVVLMGVAALVLFTGVAGLVLWKVITMYHDHMEYVKFQKEVFMAQWAKEQNPLYHGAVTSFSNPTYSENDECQQEEMPPQ